MIPPNDKLAICFAHVAYQLHERFAALDTGIHSFAVRDPDTLALRLGKAFDMRMLALRRDPSLGGGAADVVHPMSALKSLLPDADFVALTCPLTPETEKLIDADALARMKPAAYLVNVARGRVVDEAALIEALAARRIAGAALDVTIEEPPPPDSPLWGMEHVLITPHTAGETRRYEDNVIEILREHLERLWRGASQLRNQVV